METASANVELADVRTDGNEKTVRAVPIKALVWKEGTSAPATVIANAESASAMKAIMEPSVAQPMRL